MHIATFTDRTPRWWWVSLTAAAVVIAAAALTPSRAEARSYGPPRAADPTLVHDGDYWLSMSTNEGLGQPGATPCDPSDPG
jgi:hypothetical protein